MRIALKEWAVAVEAMARGEQIALVRKGGIREEGREFRVEHERFLLFPTYEHQRADLLQPAYAPRLAGVLAAWGGSATVTVTAWGEVTDSYALTTQEAVDRLAPYYVYTTGYAEERLRWKPRKPLQALVVRTYLLDEPITLPMLAEYGGCRSWISLERDLPALTMRPALPDGLFEQRRAEVRSLLEGLPAGVA